MVAGVAARLRLRTTTKAFCNCAVAADDDGDAPNAHTCPVCLALPGALPVLNERAVEQGVRAALAFGCAVPPVSAFVRRRRPAPERPAGYEITQHDRPLAGKGAVQIGETPEGAPLTVRVLCARLGEEPGRLARGRFPRADALDLNLAGAPVLHVATAPELGSPAEVIALVRSLRRLARGAGASDARLTDGSLSVRVSVSVRRVGDTKLNAPCDVVGATSFAALRAAVAAEFERQCAVADRGGTVGRERMLWRDGALVPAGARDGDAAPRHLAEPDLPPLVLTSEWIAEQRRHVPAQAASRRGQLAREFGLGGHVLDVLTADPELADYYATAARAHGDPRATADWVLGPVLDVVDRDGGELDVFALRVRPADLAGLLDIVRDEQLDDDAARQLFAAMARTGDPPARAAKRVKLLPR
jgi:aspartyl-tRNA(Asn)/glutamyl-tRNA(Gln) amidotransferase subunit B